MPRPQKTYLFFDNDTPVMIGTKREIAEALGVTLGTVGYWAVNGSSKRGLKRCVPVEDEDHARGVIANSAAKLNKACARICRATRGGCRYMSWGCDDIGWCVKCRDLVAYRKQQKKTGPKDSQDRGGQCQTPAE